MSNDKHLDEFFRALWNKYEGWRFQRDLSGLQNQDPPEFNLGPKINGSVFSYLGYEATDVDRDQTDKDTVAVEMLERAITTDCVVYDCGTYDGKRLHMILDALPPQTKNKIRAIYGIESNPKCLADAENEFQGTGFPFHPLNDRIENLLTDPTFIHDTSHLEPKKWFKYKRIILGLENIFLNINRLTAEYDDGLSGFVRQILEPKDEVILEVHGFTDRNHYTEEVETFFQNYLLESGIVDIIGNGLDSEYSKYGKRVFFGNMPSKFRYKDLEFDFSSKGNVIQKPRIYIGFSGCLPYDTLFEYLVFNFANNVFVPQREDVAFTGHDISIRFRAFDRTRWLEEAKKNQVSSTKDGLIHFGLVNHIINKELFPHYYHNFLYQPSQVTGLGPEEMSQLQSKFKYFNRIFPQTSSDELQYDETESLILRP